MKKAVTLFICLQVISGNTFGSALFNLQNGTAFCYDFTNLFPSHHNKRKHNHEKEHNANKVPHKHRHLRVNHAKYGSFIVPAKSAFSNIDNQSGNNRYFLPGIFLPGYTDNVWHPPK